MRRFFSAALLVTFLVSANNVPQLLLASSPTLRPAPRPPAPKPPTPQISRFVTIRARHTGLVLDVANFGKQDAPTNTAAYVGQANQQWVVTELPDGFCTIKARHNGLVLDVRNYGKQSAKVSTCGYVGQTNQQWKITKLPNGFSTIAARHSGLVLDVDDWGGQGAWVSTCGYVKQSNQEWLIEEIVDNSQWVNFPLKGAVDSPLFAGTTILCRSHPDGPIVIKIPTEEVEAILRKAAKNARIPICNRSPLPGKCHCWPALVANFGRKRPEFPSASAVYSAKVCHFLGSGERLPPFLPPLPTEGAASTSKFNPIRTSN